MHIVRYIGDNGELLRYEIKKEMRTRGKRIKHQYIKNQIKDVAIRLSIVLTVTAILAITLLANTTA